MYLKEIKTHGFKSFADKITIELNEGITGIVGPNGSGKSNVVDAVRWVLGEQSIKSLRGDDNMTDVIFSGSKSRNSLNVASVTLIFDNKDKYLPIDFDEVSIKRRVYIDGTNEYFINNEKVRLKDISNLLLDTGIAKESFNIISQGKIEEIISNKPSERRIVFEEAAGVLKYKKRKEEALRKLDKTHFNMQRVNDVIREIESNLEPLKEQAEKAVTYLNAKKELEEVEIGLITKDITNLNLEYQKNKDLIEKINHELLNISTVSRTNEAKILEFQNKISNLDISIANEQKLLLEITTKSEQLNSQKNILLERKQYEVEDSRIHKNLILLKEEELSLRNDIIKLKTEIEQEQETVNKTITSIKKEEELLSNLKILRNKEEIELSNILRGELNLKNKIEALKYNIDNNSSLPISVKSVISNPKLKGIHNVIGNVIDTEEKYATAIATALGLSSSYVIVDDEKSAKDAINYLKNNNLGRATFFPMNVIKERNINSDILNKIKDFLGFIGIASDLIKYDVLYKDIIKNQLGLTIIVDDLDSANEISKIINYQYKIVTLDGQQIHVGGSLTGGSSVKSKNIISEKYDLDYSLKEYEQVKKTTKDKEEAINKIDFDIKVIEDKIYLLNKEKVSNEQVYLSKYNLYDSLNEKLSKTSREINSNNNILNKKISEEEEEVLNKYYESLKEKDSIINKLSILNNNKNDLNSELEDYNFSLKKENAIFNEKSKELKNIEIETNRIDVKLDNLLNYLSETYSITYEFAKENYILDIDESLARNKVSSLRRTIKDLGVVNIGAKDEFDRIKTRYEFLNNQKDDLFNAENTLLEIIKEMDIIMEKEFIKSFNVISKHFELTFKELFKGGSATLKLTDASNILETGIEIIASPPGKRLTSISLLSGGEKTLTAISLLFAILKSREVPFCILDEAEAALDEVNVDSFGQYITNLKSKTQFILITHKKKTMEFADILYGITMQESGVSKLVSVRLKDI